jgi:UDP-glucose 4-epimerase
LDSPSKHIVVTGASGLIGSELIQNLSTSYIVHALSRSPISYQNNNIFWHKIDFNNEFDFTELPNIVESVIFLAQSADFRDFPNSALSIFRVNTFAPLAFLDYALKSEAKSFLYASSGGVYSGNRECFSEDITITTENANNFYFSSKICAEIMGANYKELINITFLRYFFVYGRGQNETMLIPRLIDSVKKGIPIDLCDSDGLHINPIHVSDASIATREAINLQGFNIINVGGSEVISLKKIANIIGENLGIAPVFNYGKSTRSDNFVGNILRMRELLHEPTSIFSDKVKEML